MPSSHVTQSFLLAPIVAVLRLIVEIDKVEVVKKRNEIIRGKEKKRKEKEKARLLNRKVLQKIGGVV